MSLKQALMKARHIEGSYVKMGKSGNWSEWWFQYFWKDDKIYWTAGMTAGGLLEEKGTLINDNSDYWYVFTEWGNDDSIVF